MWQQLTFFQYLEYLSEKISVYNICMYCNGREKTFHSKSAVQDHMEVKGHCKMHFEDVEDEYYHFYDFTASYPEEMQESTTASSSSSSSLEGTSSGPTSTTEESTSAKTTEDGDEDVELSDEVLQKYQVGGSINEYGELVLSNGRVVGHRENRVYYKQRPTRGNTRDSVMIAKLMKSYRELGYVSKEVDGEEIQRRTRTQERKKKSHMLLGVMGNKVLQKHFRIAL
eukprot:TRINITY_DN643_c0_g1_i1.p2 TRINITY_DN643_c0_g1~~TRINITY_DN643_c0_g1_i1.p2  ORF type:complete len:226 (-),score=88.89 TRINITY_DN643_c0_g1_i1:727-1404(-)